MYKRIIKELENKYTMSIYFNKHSQMWIHRKTQCLVPLIINRVPKIHNIYTLDFLHINVEINIMYRV